MLKKYISCILFFIFFGLAFADTAAFACFQNKDAHEKCRNITEIFEDNLFDKFFDEGFIATSIPISEVKSEEEISLTSIKAFFEEGPNYNMSLEKKQLKEADWQKMTVRMLDCASEKEIYKKNIDITKLKEKDVEKKAEKMADQISKEIFEAISRR